MREPRRSCAQRHSFWRLPPIHRPSYRLVPLLNSNQVARRNLTDDQRAMNNVGIIELKSTIAMRERAKTAVDAREVKAGRKEPILPVKTTDKIAKKKRPKKDTREEVSKAAKVSQSKVRAALNIKKDDPKLAAKVLAGEITIRDANEEQTERELPEKHFAQNWKKIQTQIPKNKSPKYRDLFVWPVSSKVGLRFLVSVASPRLPGPLHSGSIFPSGATFLYPFTASPCSASCAILVTVLELYLHYKRAVPIT